MHGFDDDPLIEGMESPVNCHPGLMIPVARRPLENGPCRRTIMMGITFAAGLIAVMVHIAAELTKEPRAVLRAVRQKKRHGKHH